MERPDLVIIGGLGHVGLPLGLTFANKKLRVCLYDIDAKCAEKVREKKMPFIEYGAQEILEKTIENGFLTVSTDPKVITEAENIIIAVGTPVDEYLNPATRGFLSVIEKLKTYLRIEQTLIIRSTVYPNTCKQIVKLLGEDEGWKIAYCPERIVQGYSMQELVNLPQVVSGLCKQAEENAASLFSYISPKIIHTSVNEAELIKLFSNAWRYIQFAITNQFYMISHKFGVNYDSVRKAMMDGYDRAKLPGPGFAAGPCLLKDTMQLSAFSGNEFVLGHAAMMINEGLPNFIVNHLSQQFDLSNTTIGILGMAFKADIDDIRDSLSFKLRKILKFHGSSVVCSDEFVEEKDFISKERLIELSDLVIIAVPHSSYKKLVIPSHIFVVDLWNIVSVENEEKNITYGKILESMPV